MQEEHAVLASQLDDQIDRNMRETLAVHGIGGNEKSWEETRAKLSDYLSELSQEMNKDEIYDSIIRAHRGPNSNSIFVKFNDGYVVNHVKALRTERGVYINQMRSPMVKRRVKESVRVKKMLKANDGKNWKMYVNDKVQLMIRKPDDTSILSTNSSKM